MAWIQKELVFVAVLRFLILRVLVMLRTAYFLPVTYSAHQVLLRAGSQLFRSFSSAAQPAKAEDATEVLLDSQHLASSGVTLSGTISPLNFNDPKAAFQAKSTGDIIRSLLVFKACQIQPLVRNADFLLRLSKRILGNTFTNAIMKPTFYRQFVAGSNAQDIQPALAFLRKNGIRAILDYAAEDDTDDSDELARSREEPNKTAIVRTYSYEGEGLCDRRMAVFRKSIEAAALSEGQGFAAIKITALGLPSLLERVTNSLLAVRGLFQQFDSDGNGLVTREEFEQVYQELFVDGSNEKLQQMFDHLDVNHNGMVDYVSWTKQITAFDTQAIAKQCRTIGPFARAALNEEEMQLLKNMMRRVEILADIAAQGNVRLMIDAEHTYFQTAIDNTVTLLQQKYNKKEPVIFNTYQCYLKDSYEHLLLDMERSKREGYKFGAKMVRGAYMVIERQRARDRGYPSPIYDTKEDTDAAYDRNVAEVIQHVESEGAEVMVATHNQQSIENAVALMKQLGLPPSSGVYFGQLLGMADHLSFTLGQNGYGAYKYVPFGAVDEVMPYLLRRAQENSDMLGGVGVEKDMLRTELKRRLFGRK